MEESRFFKNVWRFNALFLMVAGVLATVLATGVLGFAGYKMYQGTTRDRTTRNIVNVEENQSVDAKWKLGYLRDISGTDYVMIPLRPERSYAPVYDSDPSHSARNYLFINSKTNEKSWLFNTNDYLISDTDYLYEEGSDNGEKTVRAILYRVIKKDTNGDKRLTSYDSLTLGASKPGGERYRDVLKEIDSFFGYRVIKENKALLVYQKGGVGYSAMLNLDSLNIEGKGEIPKVRAISRP